MGTNFKKTNELKYKITEEYFDISRYSRPEIYEEDGIQYANKSGVLFIQNYKYAVAIGSNFIKLNMDRNVVVGYYDDCDKAKAVYKLVLEKLRQKSRDRVRDKMSEFHDFIRNVVV